MIKSKGIRILCYVAMGISYCFAVILLICGCSALVNEKVALGIGLIFVAIIVPFSVTLSLYPIFAISLIESHVSQLNTNIEQLLNNLSAQTTQPPTLSQEKNYQNSTSPKQAPLVLTPPISEALDFINQRYNIQIEFSDDLMTIQEKILKIDAVDNLTHIFKKRVSNATSFDEVCSIIKMHHAVNKNTFTKS